MNQIERNMMLGMIDILNMASDAYYNGKPLLMSDAQYDERLKDLQEFEKETGVIFSNSPSINVGAKILSNLPEATHNHLMLSLEKCHTIPEIVDFSNGKKLVASIKLDGMTASLLYENGNLIKAESRGNGHVGVDITEHVKKFKNVPLKISKKETYIVDGECIITDEDFAEVNKNKEFKNSRNLVSGTLNSLDTTLVFERKVSFIVWDVIDGGLNNNLADNLNEAKELGFDAVPHWIANNLDPKKIQGTIDYIFDYASEEGLPNDGIVFKFDDIEYGKSLGATSHHFKNGIAYKRKDESVETTIRKIEWSVGKSGVISPVAVFDPVELGGSTVSRATLHNISIMTDLELSYGDTITVCKANDVIPRVSDNLDRTLTDLIVPPTKCPICGGKTEIKKDNNSEVLVCTNPNCKGKLLGKLTHFVSKNAMNIENLSESTLEKFIEYNWLTKFIDIYYLDAKKEEMMKLEGFGEKSVEKLLNSIEKSKNTTLDRFIYALSIPDVGRSTAKTIASRFEDCKEFITRAQHFDWEELDGIGYQTATKINKFIYNHIDEIRELSKKLNFEEIKKNDIKNNPFIDKNICVTGKLEYFTRDGINEKITSLGAKAVNSINSKTEYLVCNNQSNSSKYKKAIELNIKIITENEFIEMINS